MKKITLGGVFLIGLLGGFSLQSYAANKLIFFPGSSTHFDYQFQATADSSSSVILKSFPRGVNRNSLWISGQGVRKWQYSAGAESLDATLSALSGGLGAGKGAKNYEFVLRDGRTVILANDRTVLFSDQDNLKAQRPDEWGISPEVVVYLDDSSGVSALRASGFNDRLRSEFSYRADYNERQARLNFQAVLRVTNDSGFQYNESNVVVRVDSPRRQVVRPRFRAMSSGVEKASDSVSVSQADESYEYHLPIRQQVPVGQTTFRMFGNSVEKVKKIYRYSPPGSVSGIQHLKRLVDVVLKFRNTTEFPLAQGVVQLYAGGSYISDAHLGPVSRNQWVELPYGRAFDITAKKEIVSEKKQGYRPVERKIRLTLKNFKTTPVSVQIRDQLPGGGWMIVKSSEKYESLSATHVQFVVDVPVGRQMQVEYIVRVTK